MLYNRKFLQYNKLRHNGKEKSQSRNKAYKYFTKGVISMLPKNKSKDINVYRKNLRKILIETILTSIGAGFCVSTINLFWNQIGMNQTAIGITQMMFTIVICLMDIPMGYVADRFNRKALNVIGDVGVAFTFVMYAFSNNMYTVIAAESLLGLFMAMTNGVDQSFIKYNCNKIDETGNLFRKVNTRIYVWRYIVTLAVMIIGGFIAKYNLRLTIGMSFIPYMAGGIIALGIHDFSGKKEVTHDNPIADMFHSIKEIVKEPKARAYLFSYITGREMTHAQIWVLTPLLIMVGVPIEIVSLGWIMSETMKVVGAKVSEKMVNFKNSNKFLIPAAIEILCMTILVIDTNIITVWLFALNGLVHGMTSGLLQTPLQEATKDEVQTSVMSVAATAARLLYIPVVYFVNYLGNIKLQLALLGVIAVFLPISIYVHTSLKRAEIKEYNSN